jgi:hypothetical protein
MKTLPPLAVSLALLAATSAVPLPAQQQLRATLLLTGPAGDVVLNAPLLDAILAETACHEAVRKAVPDVTRVFDVRAQSSVAHLPGAFQAELTADVGVKAALSADARGKVLDTIVGHLMQRLDATVVREPREQLAARLNELLQRQHEVVARHAALRTQVDAADERLRTARERHAAITAQLTEARITLVTEQGASAHLRALRDELTNARSKRRMELEQLTEEHAVHEARAQDIAQQVRAAEDRPAAGPREDLAKLRLELQSRTAAVRGRTLALDAAREQLADGQRVLSIVLEQLPVSELAVRRAEARTGALLAQREQQDALLAETEKQRAALAGSHAEAEQLGIETTVLRSLLAEAQGKYARLFPLRVQVLRGD